MYIHVCTVTYEEGASVTLPEGLVLVQDFVSPEEEALILSSVDWTSTVDSVTGEDVHGLFVCLALLLLFSNSILDFNMTKFSRQ